MFDNEDFLLRTIGILIFIIAIYFILFICANNKLPDEIKDTNCIYYEERIYCLQEGTDK